MQGRDCAIAHAPPHSISRPDSRARALSVVALALLPYLLTACNRRPEVVIHTRDGQSVRVYVELALTPEQQERGLMYRQSLAKDAGMLFVFSESDVHSFWMKNTPLPLDMLFIDAEREIVGIVEHAVPFTTTNRTVGKPSRYVLEVNAGFAGEHNMKSGDRVDLPPAPRTN